MKNKKTFTFRRFGRRDVNGVFNLLQNLSNKNKEFFHPHKFDEKTLLKNLESDDHYFIMTADDKIIGYSFLRLFGFDIPSFGCCIRNGFENKGYGSILTGLTIEKAKELGYKKVILKTYKKNLFAQKIYNKLGFKIIGETSDKKQYKMILEF